MNQQIKLETNAPLPMVLTAIVAGLVGLILGGAGVFAIHQRKVAQTMKQTEEVIAQVATELEKIKKESGDAKTLIASLETDKNHQKTKFDQMELELTQVKKERDNAKSDLQTNDQKSKSVQSKMNPLEQPIATVAQQNSDPKSRSRNTNTNGQNGTIPQNPSITLHLKSDYTLSIDGLKTMDELYLINPANLDKPDRLSLKNEKSYVINGNGLPDTKLLVRSTIDDLFSLRADKGWQPPHDSKILYVKDSGIESLYKFRSSDTIMITKQLNTSSYVRIPNLTPVSFDILNLSQSGVDWKDERWSASNQLTWSWSVAAKGNETPSSVDSRYQRKEFQIKMATLKIDWNESASMIDVTITTADGPVISDAETTKLKSVEDLTKQIKEQMLTFDLLMKDVELKWDNNRKVDVRVPLKIKFE